METILNINFRSWIIDSLKSAGVILILCLLAWRFTPLAFEQFIFQPAVIWGSLAGMSLVSACMVSLSYWRRVLLVFIVLFPVAVPSALIPFDMTTGLSLAIGFSVIVALIGGIRKNEPALHDEP